MKKVAGYFRERYPKAKIVLLADLDKKTGSPMLQSIDAAKSVNGALAIPDFGDGRKTEDTDFNDMATQHGNNAVKVTIESAIASGAYNAGQSHTDCPFERSVLLTQGDSVHPELISWLWPGWIASGKLHLIGGAPGTGKTTIAMSLAATISCGGQWPDGTPSPVGKAIIWSGEDNPQDTLVPRLLVMDADMNNVQFIAGVVADGIKGAFDPARDVDILCARLRDIPNIRLLVIDPIVSAISGDSHKNGEVRRGLQPLADLAHELGIALVGITHFAKGTQCRETGERIVGSIGFTAAARIVLVAAKDKSSGAASNRRVFARAKSNIGMDDGGFAYTIEQRPLRDYPNIAASCVSWHETIDGSAREILAKAEAASISGDDESKSALSEAEAFLRDILADGAVEAKEVKRMAGEVCITEKTLYRAKTATGIVTRREGFGKNGRFTWKLPIVNCKNDENSD